MTVICFVGKPRTGKTLGMVQYAYSNYVKGYKTFSNHHLNFPHTKLNVNEMLDIVLRDVEQDNKTLCIQEADKIFDSRRSSKEENRLLSSLTGQSGKRNLDILYDTQFWSRIDSSLRYVTEYVVSCSCTIDQHKNPVAFTYQWEDMFDGKITRVTIPAFLLEPFYKMYNTYETTEPLRKPVKQKAN